MKKKKKNLLKIVSKIFLIILCYLFSLSVYIKLDFSSATFEQLYFTLTESQGFSFESIKKGILFVTIVGTAFIFIFLVLPKLYKKYSHCKSNISLYFRNLRIFNISFPLKLSWKYYIVLTLVAIFGFTYNIGIIDYIRNQVETSTLYEDYYINPKDINISFPEEKQNLIYIYLESMESSFAKILTDDTSVSLIPELEKLANEGINFSNNSSLGGALSLNNTTWTIAAMVAHTAGIPLTIAVDANDYSGYSSFLPGVTSLGDILLENGYKNYLLIGSDAQFGGRKDYFEEHGNYQIYDYNTAKQTGFINKNYSVWWGYEDKKLFEKAKDMLLEISKNEEPFNFSMLTADTHFPNGYLDETCSQDYKDQYSNVIACSSSWTYEFINWIKEQDFYKNTTVVIVGDHLTMQYGDFIHTIQSYPRTIYNVFLNSKIETNYSKNRQFSTLDFYPTTLAALGVKIEGNKLGLGTNLFSEEKTLIEKMGRDYLNKQILIKSNYYNQVFLKNTYYDMLKNNN